MTVEIKLPADLDKHYWQRIRDHQVLDAWANGSGQRVTTDPLELPPGATGAALVVSAGGTSTLNLEGSKDGGETWERLASRSSMTGQYVATYEHEPAREGAPGVRLTHLRAMVDMWGKGAVKAGLEVLRL